MANTAKTIAPHPPTDKTIKTSRFGEISIDCDKIITFTSPFLGFPNDRSFVLLPHSPKSPFFWLQSTDSPTLAFVVIQPHVIMNNYAPQLPAAIEAELKNSVEKLELMVVLTIPPGKPREMTANLLGPVVYNTEKRLAKQVILDPNKYDPCWPVPLGA
jgi:flagellar assembly factor FliW